MKKAVTDNTFLLDYLHMLPDLDVTGIPAYYPKLGKDLKYIESPNFIYPIGGDLFVHIYPDEDDMRDYYISIEPLLFRNVYDLVERVESAIVDIIDTYVTPDTPEETEEMMMEAIGEICEIVEDKDDTDVNVNEKKRSLFGRKKGTSAGGKVFVTEEQLRLVKYIIKRDKIGMGILEPLIQDPYIEDISCDGLGAIFVEHKIRHSLKTTLSFTSEPQLDKFVISLVEKIGKPISFRDPIVDATLQDGSRINIVYGSDISKRGSNFTIRKFSDTPLSLIDLISFNAFNYEMAAYLWMMMDEGMSLFMCGETASGKTTALNAICGLIPANAKIISIEDTPEVQVPQGNWISEVTRKSSREGQGGEVGMFDLIKAALRQRPEMIIIGEIRGEEGNLAFQAMQTGHPVMATFHASTVTKLLQRITGHPINVPKSYLDNLNLVVIADAVQYKGERVRRLTSINELVGFDSETGNVQYIEVFAWNPINDTFDFKGKGASYLLEQKIAKSRGIPSKKVFKTMYGEIDRRANMLKKVDQLGINNFYDLFNVMSKMRKRGLMDF